MEKVLMQLVLLSKHIAPKGPSFGSGKRGSENTRLCEDMPPLSRMLTQLSGTRYNFVKLEEKLTYGSPVAGRAGEGSTTGSANQHVEKCNPEYPSTRGNIDPTKTKKAHGRKSYRKLTSANVIAQNKYVDFRMIQDGMTLMLAALLQQTVERIPAGT